MYEESEIELLKYQGELRQILADIYQQCESKRKERILWIDLDLSNEIYDVNFNSLSITEFAKIMINLTEDLGEENLILKCFKKLYNTLVLDDSTKATVLESKTRSGYKFTAEIDMDVDAFLENF